MTHDDFAYPYRDNPPFAQRRPLQWSPLKIVLTVLLCGGGFLMLCGGGCGAIIFFGMNLLAKEIELELRDNPVLVEHIGQVQSFKIDWMASLAHPEADVWVFNVRGPKGSGQVTAESITMPDGNERVTWATLRLPSGETIELIER